MKHRQSDPKSGTQKLLGSPNFNIVTAIAVVALVGVAGYFILATRASGSFVSSEAETATLSGNASLGTDAAASNGQFVKFNQPAVVYCSGLTPCYGPKDLAITTGGRCWGYITNRVIDLTAFAPHHSGGTGPPTSSCGRDIDPILRGAATAGNGQSFTHPGVSSDEALLIGSYSAGYYDPAKP